MTILLGTQKAIPNVNHRKSSAGKIWQKKNPQCKFLKRFESGFVKYQEKTVQFKNRNENFVTPFFCITTDKLLKTQFFALICICN